MKEQFLFSFLNLLKTYRRVSASPRFPWLLCLFLLSPPLSPAFGQEEVPWISLERLSISTSGSYHFQPWHFYNTSLALVEKVVRYDPVYVNPSGSFDRIIGDAGIELLASYRIFSGFSLEVFGSQTGTGGTMNLVERPSTSGQRTHHHEIFLKITALGLGGRVSQALSERFMVAFTGHGSIARGTVDYEYLFDPPWNTEHLFTARLRDKATSYQISLELGYELTASIRMTGAVEYRWLTFPQFQGDGNEVYRETSIPYENSRLFKARLAHIRGNFFGLVPVEGTSISNSHLMRTIWSWTELYPAWWNNLEPALFDLSSFGIRIGVRYEFQ